MERTLKWSRRRTALAGLFLVLSLIALIGLPGVTWLWLQADQARADAEDKSQKLQVAQGELTTKAKDLSKALDRNEVILSRNEVMLAYREWQANNPDQARELLSRVPDERRHWEWHYVHRLCNQELLTLDKHLGPVNCVVYCPQGKWIASSAVDINNEDVGEVRISNPKTGQFLRKLTGQHAPVRWMSVNRDGSRLATTSWRTRQSDRREIKLWDMQTGVAIQTIPVPISPAVRIVLSPDGLLVAGISNERGVQVWEVASGRELWAAKKHTDIHLSLNFSPEGKMLASSSRDGTVGFWNPMNGDEALPALTTGGDTRYVCFSPDGRYLATALYQKRVKVWEIASMKEVVNFHRHQSGMLQAIFSPDGQRIASLEGQGTVRIWDIHSGEERIIRGNPLRTRCVAFNHDGSSLAAGLGDGTVRIWDTISEQEGRSLPESWHRIPKLAFTSDSKRIAGAGRHGSKQLQFNFAGLWDVELGKIQFTFKHDDWVRSVAFSHHDRWLATASNDRTAKLWNADTGALLFTLAGHDQAVTSVGFSPDQGHLATGSTDRTVGIWDTATGQLLHKLTGHADEVTQVAYTPDGKYLLSCSRDRTIRMIDRNTQEVCAILDKLPEAVLTMAISPRGRSLACVCGKQILLWDLRLGPQALMSSSPRLVLKGHANDVIDLSFSPDESRLATTSVDWTIRLWDTETGNSVLTMSDFGESVLSVGFSPDGRLLAGGQNENIRLWEALETSPQAKETQRQASSHRHDDWHRQQAARFHTAKNPTAALVHLEALIKARLDLQKLPDFVGTKQAEHRHELAALYHQRGLAHAALQRYDLASVDVGLTQMLHRNHEWYWADHAALLLLKGDQDSYRRFSAELRQRPSLERKTGYLAYQVARVLILDPNAGVLCVNWAERGLAMGRQGYSLHALGMAYYRAGQLEEAKQTFQASMQEDPRWTAQVLNWFGLALVHHRLGNTDEAQRWREKALHWLNSEAQRNPGQMNTCLPLHPHDWLESQLLKRELNEK
jgi:WD40 repeat protein